MEEENKVQEETKKTSWILPILVVVILVGGIYFTKNNNKSQPTETPIATSTITTVATDAVASPIAVEGGMFYFKPNEIIVKKGDTVKITFTNKEGVHDFVLDEFNIKTKQIKAGSSETIEFTPTEVGEFEFYCSVSNHKAQGMVGKLIVRD